VYVYLALAAVMLYTAYRGNCMLQILDTQYILNFEYKNWY